METNLWDFLGLADRETLLSGLIGWFLNPRGEHGLGDSFLNKIIRRSGIKIDHISEPKIEVEKKVRNGRRFDILLSDGEKSKIAFEVKCKTEGSAEQLINYQNIAPNIVIVRIGFGEWNWNYPELSEKQRKFFPLIRFKDIASI
ncbi:MAG TPA: PD-(D/E)XK nuclease family protein, partial [Balneolales bacterium]|nr:PD-(D/E)XK nuclease family protein [Balneolales bacterium]